MSDHFPTRNEFLASFLRQCFSLPDSMIYYITKNPSSSKVYQKLIQCCKYFFLKNPILVFHCLEFRDNNEWRICSNHSNCPNEFHQRIATPNLSNCKLWIDYQIRIFSTKSNFAAELIPKIYQCDAEMLNFEDQIISFQKFLFFYAKNVLYIKLLGVLLTSDSCDEIPVPEIVANLPSIIKFYYEFAPSSKNMSTNTIKNLLQIPHFKNLKDFRLLNVLHEFDIDSLYDYYKDNRSRFFFCVNYKKLLLTEHYLKKLDGIVDEILDYEFHENVPPFIQYDRQNFRKKSALFTLFLKMKKKIAKSI